MKIRGLLTAFLALFPNGYQSFNTPTTPSHHKSSNGNYLDKLAADRCASEVAPSTTSEDIPRSLSVFVERRDTFGRLEADKIILNTSYNPETSFEKLMTHYLGINYPVSFYKDSAAKLKLPNDKIFGTSGILIINVLPYFRIARELLGLANNPLYQNKFEAKSPGNNIIEYIIMYDKNDMETITLLIRATKEQNRQKSIYR